MNGSVDFDVKYLSKHLSSSITTIDNEIRASRVRARITRKIQINAPQLPRVCISHHGSQTEPLLLHLKRTISRDGSVDVPRAHRVDTTAPFRPLNRQALGQVNAAGL